MNKSFIKSLSLTLALSLLSLMLVQQPALADTHMSSLEKTPSGIPFVDLEKTVDEHVMTYIGRTTPGAAVAIVSNGKIVFMKGYGYANLEKKTTVDPENTIFEWGSISKLFTWTSVMQLVEQGKLDLDVSIENYLPTDFYKSLNLNQTVTMRDLMNHSAGFGDYAFNTIVFSPSQVLALEKALLRDHPDQYYEVGTASAYSNFGASLAGYIVENVSGIDFLNYQKKNIFQPLSMDHTYADPMFNLSEIATQHKATGYNLSGSGTFEPGRWSYISHRPAGSINGSVEDLAKFALGLTPASNTQTVLFNRPHTIKTLVSSSYDQDTDMVGTAHGFFEYSGAEETLGHGGNTASFSSQFTFVPNERFGLAVLTNAGHEMNILFGLHEILVGQDKPDAKVPLESLPSSEKVEGIYVPMERQEGNFLDFIKYLGLYSVKASGVNTIDFGLGAYQGTYTQVSPYKYELTESKMPLIKNIYPTLVFRVEQGQVRQIIVGNGMDLSPLPPGRSLPVLIASIGVILTSVIYFFGVLLILCIKFIRGKMSIRHRKATSQSESIPKRASNFGRLHKGLIAIASLSLINNAIPVVKIMSHPFRTFSEMKPFLIFNYILLASAVWVAVASYRQWGKTKISKMLKVNYVTTLVLLFLLFTLLIHWNFFTIH